MIKCSSCVPVAQGPNILYKENRKLQQKLCLLFFRGIRKNILFLFGTTSLLMIANCGKDGFSQIGIGVGSSIYASGLAYKLYLNVSGMILQVISKLPSFSSRNL